MGWLNRIKDSLLSKIKKEIPKKDLESVEKIKSEIHKEEQETNEIVKESATKKKEELKIEKDPKKKKNLFQKLKTGLFKSSEKISQGVKKIFVNKKLDIQTLNDLEELLIMADLGPSAAEKLTAELANEKFDKNIKPEEVKTFLAKK